MKRSTIACIAYIAGTVVTGRSDFTLYNCGRDRRELISGSVVDGVIDIHHNRKGFHFTGTLPNVIDTERGLKVTLEIDGDSFKGKDKSTGTKFKGKVHDGQITIQADGFSSFRID